MIGSDTGSEYESVAPGPSTKKKLRTEIVHEKCVTTYSRQGFKPSETQSTGNELRRLNKAPKTSAERCREYRARKALLKLLSKQQQEPEVILGIATGDIGSAGPSEDNQVPVPDEVRILEKRAKSAEATRRWRERKRAASEASKKQAKTAAQRQREYRKRRKLRRAAAAEAKQLAQSTDVQIKQEISEDWGESFSDLGGSNPLHVRLEIQVEKDKREEWEESMNENSSPSHILPTIVRTSGSNAPENYNQDIILEKRTIDLNFFLNQIRNLNCHSPFNCSFSDMVITSEIREGLYAGLVFTCKKCKCEEIVWTEDPKVETATADKDTVMETVMEKAEETMSTGGGCCTLEERAINTEISPSSSKTDKIAQEGIHDACRKTADLEVENATLQDKRLAVENEEIEAGGLTITCKMCKHREAIWTENQNIGTVTVNNDTAMETTNIGEECSNLKGNATDSRMLPISSNTNEISEDGIKESCQKTTDSERKNAALEEKLSDIKNEGIEAGGLVFTCKMCKHKATIRNENQKIETAAPYKKTVIKTMSITKEGSNLEDFTTNSGTTPSNCNTYKIPQEETSDACQKTVALVKKNPVLEEKRLDVENEDVGSLVFTCKMCKYKETIWTEYKKIETMATNKDAVEEAMSIDGEHNSEERATNLENPSSSSNTYKTVQDEIKDSCQITTDLGRKNVAISEKQSAIKDGEIGGDRFPPSLDGC